MREIAAYRERCRSENPGARAIGELALEKLRRGKRRTAELRSVTEDLDPAHPVRSGRFLHSRQRVARFFRAPRTRREALGALALLLERFRERIEREDKHYKFSANDVRERRNWDAYQEAYEDAVNLTSTPWAPWYVVPSDHKWYRNLVVARIVSATLEAMNPRWPETDEAIEDFALDELRA